MCMVNTAFISFIIGIRGITCLRAVDNAIYSASTVLKAISICNVLRQNIEQFAYMMTIPVLDKTLSGLCEFACCQPQAKYAST